MHYLQGSQKVLEPKAFRYPVKKLARSGVSLGRGSEPMEGTKDVLALERD